MTDQTYVRCLKILCIYILFFTFSTTYTWSQSQLNFDEDIQEYFNKKTLTLQQRQKLQEQLYIQTKLIEGIQEINIVNGNYQNLNEATDRFHRLLIEAIELHSAQLPEEIQQNVIKYANQNTNRIFIKEMLISIKDFAGSVLYKKYHSLAGFARRYGMKTGIFYALIAQIDYTLPLILIQMGHPELGLPLLATPISSTMTASYIMGQNALKYNQLVKKLGGLKVGLEHLSIYKQVKAFFGTSIFGHYDLIDLNIQGTTHVLTVEKPGFMNKFLKALGWDQSIDYDGVVEIMQKKNYLPDFISQLEASNLNNHTKLYTLLAKIEQIDDPLILESLYEKYSLHINKMDNLPELSKQRQWIAKTANIKSFKALYAQMARIPAEIPPKTLDQLWRNLILVNASKNIDNYGSKTYYLAFRKLFENYDNNLRVLLMSNESYDIDKNLRDKFREYIFDALEPIYRCELDFVRFSPM